ncbi:DUF6625 family protein [Megamonas funiformis]|uniref:DUF6625 family protein n=1 Tax=Megamonas funiformis TaxID=437897 RepID=UPI00311A53AE
MKKIVFICPYFGAFPDYFNLTLKSIEYNKTIDWLIITDIKEKYDYPDNVKVINMSFTELRKKVQSCFDFKIYLGKPYKLCDYKCAYGLIFEEYIKNYDFWGHCDLDCIYGDLRKFLPENILKENERIYCLGHMSLYKNNDKVNNIFKNKIDEETDYKNIFTKERPFSFDEMGIIRIMDKEKIKIYNKFVFADIYPWEKPLICVETHINIKEKKHSSFMNKEKKQIFEFDEGHLNSIYLDNKNDRNIKKQEYMYIHLQRRFMKNLVTNNKKFLIIPNRFIDYKNIDSKFIVKNSEFFILYKRYLKLRRSWNKRKVKIKNLF